MNSKSYFINASGKNIRYVENEAIQTFYTLTKEPKGTVRELSEEDKKYFVELKPEDITFSKLVEWFGDTVNMETEDNKENRATNIKKSKYNPTDTLTITHKEYPLVEGTVQTTLGRLIYNKLIVEGVGLFDVLGYVNYVLDDSGNGKVERAVTTALKDDKMTVDQMYKYVDTRDWLGLQLHGVITTSFTPSIVKVPPSVKKLKKELLVKYKDGLAHNDPQVSEKMEKELIAATKEAFKDDIGMDLYVSGARGSIGNNYKNMYLMRGAIKNTVNDSFDVITNSLLDGLEKKSIAPHSNSILAGAYPKAVGTQVSGYLSKELISAMQAETLGDPGSDCGSVGYLNMVIPEKGYDDFMYRYIVEGGKLVCLTTDVITKYIGKKVKLRSPMYCIGVGKEKCLCNICAGDLYYKLGKKNIGLLCSRPAETTKRLGMKKFHENLVKIKQIDPNDMLL